MIIWKSTCGESWQDTIENCWEVSGKPGAFLFFLPKGALTHHPEGAVVLAVGKPCALRGGIAAVATASRHATAPAGVLLSSSARLGKYRRFNRRYFPNRLRKPATGSFDAEMDGVSAPSIFSFMKEKQKKGNEVNERWQFTIWRRK